MWLSWFLKKLKIPSTKLFPTKGKEELGWERERVWLEAERIEKIN
jgi:hypothetical protein